MAVLPGFREHFRDILSSETVQPALPELRSGSLSSSGPAPPSRLPNSYPNQSLVESSQIDDSVNLRSRNLYHWLEHKRKDEDSQTYQKNEQSPTYSERDECASSKASFTGPITRFHPSESSESSATTSRDFSNDAVQPENAETLYTYARMNWDRSNVISFSESPDRESIWFDHHSPIARKIWNSVSHLSRDELLAEFWKVKPNCRHYGSQPGKTSRHHAFRARSLVSDTRLQRHKVAELFRRTRHRIYQRDLHLMTCERARLLAENDDLYSVYRISDGNNVCALHGSKAASASKAPSKDDQLMANIYMQALSAIVVQSEHEGRKKAERLVRGLENKLKKREKHIK